MSDLEALWRACVASPDDGLPRMVLADWLDEGGSGHTAAVIRSPAGRHLARDLAACRNPLFEPWRAADRDTRDREIVSAAEAALVEVLSDDMDRLGHGDDLVNAEMAMTNATDWMPAGWHPTLTDVRPDAVRVRIPFVLMGRQDGERAFYGDRITGTAVATVTADGVEEFAVTEAEMDVPPAEDCGFEDGVTDTNR